MAGRAAVEAGRGVWLSERTSGRHMTWVSEGLALDSLCAAGSTGVYQKRRSRAPDRPPLADGTRFILAKRRIKWVPSQKIAADGR